MRRSAMARSFSWNIAAGCYGALYRKAVALNVPPRFRHHEPDQASPIAATPASPKNGDAAAELVADIAGKHGAQGRTDAGCGADNALRQIEVAATVRDVGDDQRHHDAEHRCGDAVEHLDRDEKYGSFTVANSTPRIASAREAQQQ